MLPSLSHRDQSHVRISGLYLDTHSSERGTVMEKGYLIRNLAIHTFFYKESESEVQKWKMLEPGEKN